MQGHSVTAVDLEFLFERGSQGGQALFPEAWVHSRFRNLSPPPAGPVPHSDLASSWVQRTNESTCSHFSSLRSPLRLVEKGSVKGEAEQSLPSHPTPRHTP